MQICCLCQEQLKDEQYIQFIGRGTYHRLKSKVIYAIDPKTMDIDPRSLAHVDCLDEEEPFHDVEIN